MMFQEDRHGANNRVLAYGMSGGVPIGVALFDDLNKIFRRLLLERRNGI